MIYHNNYNNSVFFPSLPVDVEHLCLVYRIDCLLEPSTSGSLVS